MTAEQRSDINNGMWLCQTHAKLIDDDELTYTGETLHDWKAVAEHMAALEARGYSVRRAKPFTVLERKVPKLLAEMRKDLAEAPLVRELIILSKRLSYSPGDTPSFTYHPEDHEYLLAVMKILEHHGAVYEITFNNVPRYTFTEDFVSYLLNEH